MSTVDEVLAAAEVVDAACVIDGETRIISVPTEYKELGVESDEKVTRVKFRCPKIVGDNIDLTGYNLYINYRNAANKLNSYLVEDATVTGDTINFSWLLSRHVTEKPGTISYIVCAKKSDYTGVINEWNTKVATGTVGVGLEATEEIEEQNIDIIEQILRSIVKLENKVDGGGSGGSGLTTAQVNALDGMFKVCAYDDSKDVSGAYAAFKAAFGLVDSGVTTYTITAELMNVTSSNSATSITEGASYTATLTAADGYEIDSVSVLMGGVDVTADVYADGVISIASVTGNVEIAASAIESEVTEALNTDGLVFNYDFRNSAMESYNLSGWGNVYRTVDKTGNSLIFGTTEATGDEKGLKDYGFRGNRLVSSETENVKLGETYTVQALFRAGDKRVQPSLFEWGTNVVSINRFKISPKYLVGTTETSTTVDQYSHEDTQYIVITYVVSGKSLTVYHNTDLVLTLDGNNYENFTKWMDYGVPNSIYNTGYITAFVGYNRALTQSEIMDNIAFFKTLEVTT